MMTIPIGRSARTKVKTLGSPRCHPISKKTIWTTSRMSYIQTRRTIMRQFKLQGFHYQSNRAVQILSLHVLHFQICDIWLGPSKPPLLKRQKSTINILCKSDVVPAQALPLPKAGGDQNVPQPKVSRDHNLPQHQKATFEVAKWFMEGIELTKTPWPIISDEKYLMVDDAWNHVIEAQNRQWAFVGAPIGIPSVCQLPSGPSLEINLQTREAVSIYSGFYSSIGVIMILSPRNICR